MKHKIFVILVIILFFCACQKDDSFIKDVNEWHAHRIERLTRNTSWLSLAGLYWLEQGENKFGSDISNEIVFPAGTPSFMGSFILQDSIVTIKINDGITVLVDSTAISEIQLKDDHQENTTIVSYNNFSWYIIKRGDLLGIRLRDSEHPTLKNFRGIERYPVDPRWNIKARLKKYPEPKTLKIPNVLGQVEDEPCPGALVFEIEGKEYSLDPIKVANSNRYWVIFGDATNGDGTYNAGRFLYMDAADENGIAYIDFNRSYNPPCVFSHFATCPLPPPQNKLDVKITAGEKMYYVDQH